jgi:acyl-coenzyme A synthetase/AMP-(fatty) acid ligase
LHSTYLGAGLCAVDGAITAGESTEYVSVKATIPLNIPYTAGTADHPQGVVRNNGGHIFRLEMGVGASLRDNTGLGFLGGP